MTLTIVDIFRMTILYYNGDFIYKYRTVLVTEDEGIVTHEIHGKPRI